MYVHTHICIHTHIHTYVQTYIHTYTHIHINTYIHTFIHTHTHTYVHTYIQTYTHQYIHTHPKNKKRCHFLVDPLGYFLLQPVLQNWWNKGRGMCYPVYGMVHIKEPMLLIGNAPPVTDSARTARTPLYPPVQVVPPYSLPHFPPVLDSDTGEGATTACSECAR